MRVEAVLFLALSVGWARGAEKAAKKKDVRDYTDADMERLYQQWEEDEEPLEDDELPQHLRKAPAIDLSKVRTRTWSGSTSSGRKEDEEPLEDDELPQHLRKAPAIDLSKIDLTSPEAVMAASKKGKTLMMFVAVDKALPKEEAERLTGLWQSSLFNNHLDVQRYMIEDNRAIFMFQDGAQAFEAKEFLVKQDGCAEVSLEGKEYPGKAAKEKSEL